MAKITFKAEPEYHTLGRNGYSRSAGLNVSRVGDTVMLEPINSKGDIGRARLVVPLDQVDDLVAALNREAR